jgi:hypothetical protein
MWRTFGKWRNLTTGTSVESGTNPTADGVPFEVRLFRRRKGILMAIAIRGEGRSVSPQRLGVFNCLNARERIRCHPEFAAVTVHLAHEESTRAHSEDSGSIQFPRPRNRSGIV